MPPRQRPLSDHDRAAWAAYVRNVQILAGRPLPPEPPPPAAAPAKPDQTLPASPATPTAAAPPGLLVTGVPPAGLDKSTWNRLRGGKMAPARTLDLHGKTAQAAFHALQRFLVTAHAEQIRCVEIITGRGSGEHGGILMRELPHWLNLPALRPLVLAASHPHEKNPGSTRILLRRARTGRG
jgi:DNA-nicking Smr family endonuclease